MNDPTIADPLYVPEDPHVEGRRRSGRWGAVLILGAGLIALAAVAAHVLGGPG